MNPSDPDEKRWKKCRDRATRVDTRWATRVRAGAVLTESTVRGNDDASCLLCGKAVGDISHWLDDCSRTSRTRSYVMTKLAESWGPWVYASSVTPLAFIITYFIATRIQKAG